MEAHAKNLWDILSAPAQYLIPLFQRNYSWQPEQWTRLQSDIWALLEQDKGGVHFLGPMVCTGNTRPHWEMPRLQLIDGQQRLTTLTVLLAAMHDVARTKSLHKLADEIRDCFLINMHKEDDERHKVVPKLGDRQVLAAIIEGAADTIPADNQLRRVYTHFRRRIEHVARRDAEKNLRRLFTVTTGCVYLVVIIIDEENPYEIFESLNSTGLPLEEADLIRNFVFMQIPLEKQDSFHAEHWAPFEKLFADAKGEVSARMLTEFFRCYLMREGRYIGRDAAFTVFKEQFTSRSLTPKEAAAELAVYARLYLKMVRPKPCEDSQLGDILQQIADLDAGTAYPLILNLLHRWNSGSLARPALITCLCDLCSFLIRRLACSETTRPYNKWFLEAIRSLGDSPASVLGSIWAGRGWPDDESFVEGLETLPIYSNYLTVATMLLKALERNMSPKEMSLPAHLTVEHVMPQTIRDDEAGKAWKTMLGQTWEHDHTSLLHTLGNLTLTGYNPELGNKAFDDKKKLLNDKGKLLLNESIRAKELWNGDIIRARSKELGLKIAKIWSRGNESVIYPPSGRKRTQQEGLSPSQRRRLAYWEALREFLQMEEGAEDSLLPEPGCETTCWFPTGLPGFEDKGIRLWAWMNRGKRELTVGMTFERPFKHVWEKLRGKRAEIDLELAGGVNWYSYGLSIKIPDISFSDQDDWEIQHAWIADQIGIFRKTVIPNIDPADLEGLEKEGYRKRFWNMFTDHLRECGHSGTNIPTPSKDNWLTYSVGRSGAGFATVLSTWDTTDSGAGGELRVEFWFNHEKAGKWFELLQKQSQEFQEKIGQPLHWYEADGVKTRRIFVRTGANPFEEDLWPEYCAWLSKSLEKICDVFRPVVAELP